jgi:hypothetical protein
MILSIVCSAGATAEQMMLVIAYPQFGGMHCRRLPELDLREGELGHKGNVRFCGRHM